ncbi:P63C domain-containing protein [Algoriphagus aquimarinus]|uniref:Bacteriophage Mx8 p63 C-terminal domain-containing protein n=1 Tax=Algoriphagus aquimarinus TaxID=237018 RepID=A0A5C7ACL2_9BACT|nr:P63C domain-containing protein [Algoriphagus aquimarinus]TXE04739.1 hypothetical protein ESV85_18535 [Algoriphagus aquimarinus]
MKTKYTEEELRQLKVLQDEKNKKFLKDFILQKTDAKIEVKGSDTNLDKELEKQQLLEIVSHYWQIESIGESILAWPSDYFKIFPQDYYREIYRLHKWEIPDVISDKPWIVGKYTNEIIYYRFSHEVLPFLRIINPYKIPGKREYKHHQYLTDGARIKLSQFINDAIEEMKNHEDWNSFRIDYCKKYKVPYQLRLIFA